MNSARVLILDHKMTSHGGAQHYLTSLVAALVAQDFNVDVALNVDAGNVELRDSIAALGASIHDLPAGQENPRRAAGWTRNLIDELRPEILHVNHGGGATRRLIAEITEPQRLRCKKILTLHGPLEANKHGASISIRQRLPFSRQSRKLQERRRFLRWFDKIITVSECNGEVAIDRYRLRPDNVVFVANGVDIDTFLPAGRASDRPRVVVGTCGRLHWAKRGDVLIRAVAQVAEERPVELRFAGEGPEADNLRSLASELDIESQVKLLGQQKNVAEFLQSLDVFAMTSEREGLPYALLEAMSCGLPSIVTSVNELPRIVRDGVEGFVVTPTDVDACAAGLMQLVDSAELRQTMGGNARSRVCERYSVQTWKRETLAVYQEMLDVRTRSSVALTATASE